MDIMNLIGRRIRDVGQDVVFPSHKFLLRGGYVRQLASGLYSLLPLGRRVMTKIEGIIREEMNQLQAEEVLLPLVMPKDLWEQSGRYESIGQEMLRFQDRHGSELLLAMTHEEAAVALAKSEVLSYRHYPFCFYQVQAKFRDELRPRGGLLRVREFIMKDAYSFHTDQSDLENFYDQTFEAYKSIFKRCGIKDLAICESETGIMGGTKAHEFRLICDSGEETLLVCDNCQHQNLESSSEIQGATANGSCPNCSQTLEVKKTIELGHIFQLGDRYTKSLKMTFVDDQGQSHYPLMGCYGIGVGRLMASIIEQTHSLYGPVWPASVAPFDVHLMVLHAEREEIRAEGRRFYENLKKFCDPIIDDRLQSSGAKFVDADLIGVPLRVIFSKNFLEDGKIEIVDLQMNEKIECTVEAAIDLIRSKIRAS